jgi:hypothetical protein
LILLLAAGLKAHAAFTAPTSGAGIFGGRWLQIGLAEYEAILGVYALLALARKVTWHLALVTFVAFFLFSLYQALSGVQSCGCFGSVAVHPALTVTIDLVILAGLAFGRPRVGRAGTSRGPGLGGGRLLFAIALTVVGGSGMSLLASVVFAAQTDPDNGTSFAILEPERWQGTTCPLLGHIDVGPQVTNGNWLLILHRDSCPKCQRLLEQCEDWLQKSQGSDASTRIAYVAVPPSRISAEASSSPGKCLLAGKLDESRTWLIETPVLLRLDDGVVRSVHTTLEDAVSAEQLGDACSHDKGRERMP